MGARRPSYEYARGQIHPSRGSLARRARRPSLSPIRHQPPAAPHDRTRLDLAPKWGVGASPTDSSLRQIGRGLAQLSLSRQVIFRAGGAKECDPAFGGIVWLDQSGLGARHACLHACPPVASRPPSLSDGHLHPQLLPCSTRVYACRYPLISHPPHSKPPSTRAILSATCVGRRRVGGVLL